MTDFTTLRQSYNKAERLHTELLETSVDACPFAQFAAWMQQALDAQVPEPYAMTLATADQHGRPSARIVLMRQHSKQGFEFYTNYESHKGLDLLHNPQAELMFFWTSLEQQVRIYGQVEKLSEQASIDYFHKRPVLSQIAAHASTPQSSVIASRQVLDERFQALQTTLSVPVVKPDSWGGYRVIPSYFEFWQGRSNRMHDRLTYQLQDGVWRIARLMP